MRKRMWPAVALLAVLLLPPAGPAAQTGADPPGWAENWRQYSATAENALRVGQATDDPYLNSAEYASIQRGVAVYLYTLTLSQVAVDIYNGDPVEASNRLEAFAWDQTLGHSCVGPYWAAGQIVYQALDSASQQMLGFAADRLYEQYQNYRLASLDQQAICTRPYAQWFEAWRAQAPHDFANFCHDFGDYGALRMHAREEMIRERTQAGTVFDRIYDRLNYQPSEQEVQEFLFARWEPRVLAVALHRAVGWRRDYLARMDAAVTVTIRWRATSPLGPVKESAFNGLPGRLGANGIFETKVQGFRHACGVLANPWGVFYRVEGGGEGTVPLSFPARSNRAALQTVRENELLLDLGEVLADEIFGLLVVDNQSGYEEWVRGLKKIPARSEARFWIAPGRHTLITSVGLKTVVVQAGKRTSLVLTREPPPPPPPPQHGAVKARLDEMAQAVLEGRMRRKGSDGWEDQAQRIAAVCQGTNARVPDERGGTVQVDLGWWANDHRRKWEEQFAARALKDCQAFGRDRAQELFQSWPPLPEMPPLPPQAGAGGVPGDPRWGTPPHGMTTPKWSSVPVMIAEDWMAGLEARIEALKKARLANRARADALLTRVSGSEGLIQELGGRLPFVLDWAPSCTPMETSRLQLHDESEKFLRQVAELDEGLKRIERPLADSESDRQRLGVAISRYRANAKEAQAALQRLQALCGPAEEAVKQRDRVYGEIARRVRLSDLPVPVTPPDTRLPGEARELWGEVLRGWKANLGRADLPAPERSREDAFFLSQDPTARYADATVEALRAPVFACITANNKLTGLLKASQAVDLTALTDAYLDPGGEFTRMPPVMGGNCFRRSSYDIQCADKNIMGSFARLRDLRAWWLRHQDLLRQASPKPPEPPPPEAPPIGWVGPEKVGLAVNGRPWASWQINYRHDLESPEVSVSGGAAGGLAQRMEIHLVPSGGGETITRSGRITGAWSQAFSLLPGKIYEVQVYWFNDRSSGPIGYGEDLFLAYRYSGDTEAPPPQPPPPSGPFAEAVLDPCAAPKAFVTGLYRVVYGREPDAQGLQFHADRLKRGASRQEVTRDFFTDPNFRGTGQEIRLYVSRAYRAVLGRKPSTSEETTGCQRIQGGADRYELLAHLFSSQEYAGIQKRCGGQVVTPPVQPPPQPPTQPPPQPPPQPPTTTPGEPLAGALADPCAKDRPHIASLYRSILDREATEEEAQRYLEALQNHSRDELVRDLFGSKYNARQRKPKGVVRDAYQAILAREPTQAESDQWSARLQAGEKRDVLVEALLACDERKRLIAACKGQ